MINVNKAKNLKNLIKYFPFEFDHVKIYVNCKNCQGYL